jgi:hypothetical protein
MQTRYELNDNILNFHVQGNFNAAIAAADTDEIIVNNISTNYKQYEIKSIVSNSFLAVSCGGALIRTDNFIHKPTPAFNFAIGIMKDSLIPALYNDFLLNMSDSMYEFRPFRPTETDTHIYKNYPLNISTNPFNIGFAAEANVFLTANWLAVHQELYPPATFPLFQPVSYVYVFNFYIEGVLK